MFKLIKILGGKSNAPEITTAPADTSAEYLTGAFYYLTGGKLSTIALDKSCPKFMPIESIPSDDPRDSVKGYFVNENMIFETSISGEPGEINVGDSFSCIADELGHLTSVEATAGEDGTIINGDRWITDGIVLVTLKK